MVIDIDIDSDFPDDIANDSSDDNNTGNRLKGTTLADKQIEEQAQRNLLARKRIDELQEKKRLKNLLDDSEDW